MSKAPKYIQDWLPHNDELSLFYKGIDELLTDFLINDHLEDGETLQPKIIADPLLGYIHFTRLEVAVIDTRLFQRLRKIRQLGLAHLVFPSLGYSRFEHSLGVLGRLNQVVNKLSENNLRNNPDDNLGTVIERYIIPLRLSALLHDVGHCLFSHCSERIVEKAAGSNDYPSAKTIQNIFTKHFEKDRLIPFAEIFAVTIIGSEKFLEFIEPFANQGKSETKKMLSLCGRFILGLPAKEKPETVFLAQLISSGLDADKIDYMNREQHYSGIKLEIDLDRILSKLQVFELTSSELPKHLQSIKKLYKANDKFKVLGFGKGGQFAFEEFCVARLALNVKIYLHQKVRAAESQLSKYLELISQHPLLQEAHNWLRLPEAIIEYPDVIFNELNEKASLPLIDAGYSNEISHQIADINFKKIDNREIYHRAFAFGPINSFSESLLNQIDDNNLIDEIKNFFDDYKVGLNEHEIIQEVTNISNLLGIEVNEKFFNEIVIDLPRLISIQQGQESIHFERPNLIPVKWTIPIDKIVIYFQENRALGFVFAPREIADVVSIATEKIVYEKFKKKFNQEGNISRTTFNSVSILKRRLEAKGYYHDYPQLREISDYLKQADASEKIQSIFERLKGFRSMSNEMVTIERIITFVNQFPHDLQEACLSFLQHLEVFDEQYLADALSRVLQKAADSGQKIAVCQLGGPGDSGSILNYKIRHVLEKFNIDNSPMSDSLVLGVDKLVFYDDNINSGRQLLNIFAEILGEDKRILKEYALPNEDHLPPLNSEAARAKFREIPIEIVYIVGFSGIEEKITGWLKKYLKFKGDNIRINIHKEFSDSGKIFSGKDSRFQHEKKRELREFLSSIGESLLKAEGKGPEKIESCKLGYAGAEAMVLFPYNIPTMTITPIWCKGETGESPWIPIAERRRRTNKEGHYIGED